MICNKCSKNLSPDLFYIRNDVKSSGRRQPCIKCWWPITYRTCSICSSEYGSKGGALGRKGGVCDDCYPLHRKIDTLFYSARGRARSRGLEFSLTKEWLLQNLQKPCPFLKVPFELNKTGRSYKDRHPFTPSVDKINPDLGYTIDNSRLVCWWYNLAKAKYSDEEVLEFCNLVVSSYATVPVPSADHLTA